MLLWALVILAAWILLSFPVAVVVGRMFAARPAVVARPARTSSVGVDRVAHLSCVEVQALRGVAVAARGPGALRGAPARGDDVRGPRTHRVTALT